MEQLMIPEGYKSQLNLHDTQIGIKTVKDFFQQSLAQRLNLLVPWMWQIRRLQKRKS